MKDRLRSHMDLVFAGKPNTDKVRELKEEMTQNLFDKYDDLILEGKSPEEAYRLAITSVGDVSELVNELVGSGGAHAYTAPGAGTAYNATPGTGTNYSTAQTPPPNPNPTPTPTPTPTPVVDTEEVRKYRSRKAICTTIAVILYILCITPLFIFQNIIGLIGMFVVIAIATGLIIYSSMTRPVGMKDENGKIQIDEDMAGLSPKSVSTMRVINAILWPIIVIIYIALSFTTGAWHITWLLFPISGIIEEIFKAILELSEENKK